VSGPSCAAIGALAAFFAGAAAAQDLPDPQDSQDATTVEAICDFAATVGEHDVDPAVLASARATADDRGAVEIVDAGRLMQPALCQLLDGIDSEEVGHVNSALSELIAPNNGLAFLKDVDFKLKMFEPHDSTGRSGLGLSYDYAKVNPLGDYNDDPATGVISGWAWHFKAKGDLAFDSDVNPTDFLDTRFSISGFRNKWLARQTIETLSFADLNKLEDELAEIEDPQELQVRLAEDTVVSAVRAGLPRVRSYIDFEFNAGLESDQKFEQQQWTYGAQVALDFKSYDRTAWQTTFNVLDWPFAVVRRLTGYDGRFRVYGSTLPTLVLGIDQVDPKDNEVRQSLGATDKFDRYRAEVFFRTPVARVRDEELFFNFDYRHLKESNPPPSVVTAGLDEFKYTVISIAASSGIFVSYRDGMLPFDLEDEQVYEIGWKFDLGGL
jgi:hypothetical protein